MLEHRRLVKNQDAKQWMLINFLFNFSKILTLFESLKYSGDNLNNAVQTITGIL